MHNRLFITSLRTLALALLALPLLPGLTMAAVFNLRADTTTVTMPDNQVIPMWGFALGSGPVTVPGPLLQIPPGDTTLTIQLANALLVPVSIVIPGQPAALAPVRSVDGRVTSLTMATSPGATGIYTWSNLRPGTYLYHSGTHPAVQVQMGLYGAVKHDYTTGNAYPGVQYNQDVLLVYSEIDPALHNAVAPPTGPPTYGTPAYPSTLPYKPQYFLVNGQPFSTGQTPLSAGNPHQDVLLRFLNAGLKSHMPTLLGPYLHVIAEDGNLYPYAREQYAVLLPPGKTLDALWSPSAAGTHAVYDRSLHLTTGGAPGGGMLAYLQVVDATVAPTAVADSYSVDEDTTLTVTAVAQGVLDNDMPPDALTALLVSTTGHGTLTLNADGTFIYQPTPNFAGTDFFTYKVKNGTMTSNTAAAATITVTQMNDAPIARPDAYEARGGNPLNLAAPGVLANDTDIDGNALSAQLQGGPTGGMLTLNANGSLLYTPSTTTGTFAFTYTAFDGSVNSAPVTVTITVRNTPPVANNDAATARMYSTVTPPPTSTTLINVLANDTDDGNNIAPSTVVSAARSARGGTLVRPGDGTVRYTPPRGFRGTDTFTYTVRDTVGALSNVATVRVNVVP